MIARCIPVSPSSFRTADRDFDRMVSTFFDGAPFAFSTAAPRNVARAGFPPINVLEDQGNFFVEAELPGFKLADLDISLLDNELTITGARDIPEPADARIHRRERASGRFARTLRVATDIDAAKVSAKLEHGVLTITLPKAEAAKPHKIDIKPN